MMLDKLGVTYNSRSMGVVLVLLGKIAADSQCYNWLVWNSWIYTAVKDFLSILSSNALFFLSSVFNKSDELNSSSSSSYSSNDTSMFNDDSA